MKKLHVKEAIGVKLCHDITRVAPGQFKGVAFAKGHVIGPDDVDKLLDLGKEYIYIWEEKEGFIHEDEAAIRIAQKISGENISFTLPQEGKATLKSQVKGLLKLNQSLLFMLNSIPDVSIATLPENFTVDAGQKVAGARIIPLLTDEANIVNLEQQCEGQDKLLRVIPYKKLKVGFVISGNEVYNGRIKDKFEPVLKEKMAYFDADLQGTVFCPDDTETITKAIIDFAGAGVDLILATGGMSVDPDDVTPDAIRKTGAEVITHGAPVQPGNMFMVAYLNNTCILGIPAAAMHFKRTILDLVLPRIFVGEKFSKGDFIKMGKGGLCSNCPECTYPYCYFCR